MTTGDVYVPAVLNGSYRLGLIRPRRGPNKFKEYNFRLPGEESGRQKWLDAIPSHSNIKNYSVICSLHFRPQDIIKHSSVSKLKSDAVPTIFPKV